MPLPSPPRAAALRVHRRARRGPGARRVLGLGALLALSLVLATTLGSMAVPPREVLGVLAARLGGAGEATGVIAQVEAIVWEIRLPRAVLAAAAGAGLAVVGALLQTLVRNPLADPYLLGVNAGASVGAAAALLFGAGTAFALHGLQAAAVLGALAASLVVLLLAGRTTATRLLLAGVAVGYALTALTSLLVFASDSPEATRSVMFWLLGSMALAGWDAPLLLTVLMVAVAVLVLTAVGPRLDALALGDATAASLGVDPVHWRTTMTVLACLVVGVVVASVGSIGFVGLVVPHLARRLVGGAHRAVVPVAGLLGAILLVWADVLARLVLAPQELPLGILTALLGAPFVLLLLRKA